eukprot:scaffold207_cov345-Pavlova_lutheri.AAC.30
MESWGNRHSRHGRVSAVKDGPATRCLRRLTWCPTGGDLPISIVDSEKPRGPALLRICHPFSICARAAHVPGLPTPKTANLSPGRGWIGRRE